MQPHSQQAQLPIEDLRARLFGPDFKLLVAAHKIAETVSALPPRPEYGNRNPEALISGGFVRDTYLGRESSDLDMEAYGVSHKELGNILRQTFPEHQILKHGGDFPLYEVLLTPEKKIQICVASRQRPDKKGTRLQTFHAPDLGLFDAALRRDFTINAIIADPLRAEVVDYFDGLSDLASGTIRALDKRKARLHPVNIMRAVGLAARLEFTIEPETYAELHTAVKSGSMYRLETWRARSELAKILLRAERPSRGLELMRDLGILHNSPFGMRALTAGDRVWQRTLATTDSAAKIIAHPSFPNGAVPKQRLMFAALLYTADRAVYSGEQHGRLPSERALRALGCMSSLRKATSAITSFMYQSECAWEALSAGARTEQVLPELLNHKALKMYEPRLLLAAACAASETSANSEPALKLLANLWKQFPAH